jgi:hypothetical protein
MARETCAHCLRSFEESELTAVGGRLLCPRCQLAAASAPPPSQAKAGGGVRGAARPASAVKLAVAGTPGFFGSMHRGAREWATGRCWWARLPLLALFAYILVRHLSAPWYPTYRSIFAAVNLAIHEAGHLLVPAGTFGRFLHLAAGSAFQCLVPLLCIFMFLKQRDFFAMALCLGWCAINVFEVGDYVADSQARNWILVSPVSSQPLHDWAHLLTSMGIDLSHAKSLGGVCRALGTLLMAGFLLPGSWLVWRMWVTRGQLAGKRSAGAGAGS